MKRIALVNVFVLIASLITACGGSTPAATQVPAATQPPAATEAVQQPAATEAPIEEATMTEAPAASGESTPVEITLVDNKIQASLTEFKVDVPYTFVITNKGNREHNFHISTPVSIAGGLDNAESTALLSVTEAQIPPGTTYTVDFTFPDSAAGAQLEFSCLIPRHYQMGMYVGITVTK